MATVPATPASDLDPRIAARLKRDPDGLVAAVVQQHDTGEVLMVGWMDDEALHRTLTTGRATYWSRSRQEYWVKGETSGHQQWVRSVALDCDGDALLVRSTRSARPATPVTAPASTPTCCWPTPRLPCADRRGEDRSPRSTAPRWPSWPDRTGSCRSPARLLADAETPVGVYRKLAGGRPAPSCWSRPSRARPGRAGRSSG